MWMRRSLVRFSSLQEIQGEKKMWLKCGFCHFCTGTCNTHTACNSWHILHHANHRSQMLRHAAWELVHQGFCQCRQTNLFSSECFWAACSCLTNFIAACSGFPPFFLPPLSCSGVQGVDQLPAAVAHFTMVPPIQCKAGSTTASQ